MTMREWYKLLGKRDAYDRSLIYTIKEVGKDYSLEDDFIKKVHYTVQDLATSYNVGGSHVNVEFVLKVIKNALNANKKKIFD